MPTLGLSEILIILGIIILLFGAKKLPDLARSVGRSMRIFKSEVKEMTNDDQASENAQPQQGQLGPAQQQPGQDVWNQPNSQPAAPQQSYQQPQQPSAPQQGYNQAQPVQNPNQQYPGQNYNQQPGQNNGPQQYNQ